MRSKDTFVVDRKYKERFARWGAEKGYAILMAMFEYEETGEINLPDEYYDAFEPIKEDLDARKKKWEEVCERNRRNGQNGGRPKKTDEQTLKPSKTQKTQAVLEEPKKADKDKDIDIDIKKNREKETEHYFDEFWAAYPRKVSKQAAYKAFLKLKVTPELLDQLLKAIEEQKKSAQWQDAQYIPHPATWLNGERWNDVLPKPKNKYNYEQRESMQNEGFGLEYIHEAIN